MAKRDFAIVLCSGGLDSVTTANFVKKDLGYEEIIILFFDYGQRTIEMERRFSKETANRLNAKFIEININELNFLSDSLINTQESPGIVENLKDTKEESDKFYVPCRNVIFLSYALALSESIFFREGKVADIFIGFKSEGKEPFPDATPEFLEKINSLSKTSCATHFKTIAPFIDKDKEEIILIGSELGVDFKKTFSCYVGADKHCGVCLACKLRKEGFKWACLEDPTEYSIH